MLHFATPILANAGVPMIFPQFILMGIALVPVVLVESFVVRRSLKLPWIQAIKDTGIANFWSTLLGIPLAWAVMFAIEIIATRGYALGMNTPLRMLASVTLQSAWLIPYEHHIYWMVPAAATFLLIPSFFASVWIERWILKLRWKTVEPKLANTVALRANLWSNLALLLAGTLWTLSSI